MHAECIDPSSKGGEEARPVEGAVIVDCCCMLSLLLSLHVDDVTVSLVVSYGGRPHRKIYNMISGLF